MARTFRHDKDEAGTARRPVNRTSRRTERQMLRYSEYLQNELEERGMVKSK